MRKGRFDWLVREWNEMARTDEKPEDVAIEYVVEYLTNLYCDAYQIQTAFGPTKPKIEELIEQYEKLEDLENIIGDVKDLIKHKTLEYMEQHKMISLKGNKFEVEYHQGQLKNRLDQNQLKKDYPELYLKYRKPMTTQKPSVKIYYSVEERKKEGESTK